MDWQFPDETLPELLPERSGPDSLIHAFERGEYSDTDRFARLMRSVGIDPTGCFFAAVCIGVKPDHAKRLRDTWYTEYVLQNQRIYRDVAAYFQKSGTGIEIFRNMHCICVLGAFPGEHRMDYVERYLQPAMAETEGGFALPLLLGVGNPVYAPEEVLESIRSAERMFRLYFFEPASRIEYRDHRNLRHYNALDDYLNALEAAFRAILLKSPDALDKLVNVLDIIARFHYGNRGAFLMFTMEYTGELTSRLNRYRLLRRDFFEIQDRLQEQVIHAPTFPELKQIVRRHFEPLLNEVFENDRPRGKLVVEQVKDYIREHYMEELSLQRLASVAYVSPDYFSHMFKNETGKTYKAFLTEIRMKNAVELLRETELRVAQISEKVGYNNTRAFVDAFKQTYGVSPMEYRRVHKKHPKDSEKPSG